MTVPTIASGSGVSLANIQFEFGGANPVSINEYYAAIPGSSTYWGFPESLYVGIDTPNTTSHLVSNVLTSYAGAGVYPPMSFSEFAGANKTWSATQYSYDAGGVFNGTDACSPGSQGYSGLKGQFMRGNVEIVGAPGSAWTYTPIWDPYNPYAPPYCYTAGGGGSTFGITVNPYTGTQGGLFSRMVMNGYSYYSTGAGVTFSTFSSTYAAWQWDLTSATYTGTTPFITTTPGAINATITVYMV